MGADPTNDQYRPIPPPQTHINMHAHTLNSPSGSCFSSDFFPIIFKAIRAMATRQEPCSAGGRDASASSASSGCVCGRCYVGWWCVRVRVSRTLSYHHHRVPIIFPPYASLTSHIPHPHKLIKTTHHLPGAQRGEGLVHPEEQALLRHQPRPRLGDAGLEPTRSVVWCGG